MSEWKRIPFNQVASFSYGKMPKKDLLGKGEFQTYSGYKYLDKYPEYNCDADDLIVVARGVGGSGDVKLVNRKCYLTNLSIKFDLDQKVIFTPYLYYYFQWNNLRYLDSGSAQSQITINDLSKVELTLPPLPEQKAIASVLSSLDDKIDLLHRQNKTLEAMAETLFRQWFIEEAKEDWEECRLGDLIEIKGGFSYKGEFIGYGDSLLLGMGCVSFDNRFLSTGARQYAGTCSERFYAQPGDIVIATRQQSDNLPILGFPAMIPDDYKGKNVIVGTNLYSLKNHSDLSNRLIFQIFRSKDYRIHIIASAKGSTVRMITKDAIEDFCFSMPDVETINKLELHLDSLVSKLNENFKQIQTLENLRDTLLPKLMSGEVRVQYQTEEVA